MKLSEITPNAKNPRLIKEERFKKLVTSLENLPDFTAIRSIILDEDKNIIGGNMRYRAMKHLGWKTAIVQVYDREYHAETKAALELGKSYEDVCREMVIRDNVAFGEHDFDILANEYDPLELDEWGLDVWQPQIDADSLGEEFSLADGDKPPFQSLTFTLADEQAEFIKNALADAKGLEELKYIETMGNDNSNGNALYFLVSQWVEQRI